MAILEKLFRHQELVQIFSAPGIVDVIMVESKEASVNKDQKGVSSHNHPKENLQGKGILYFGWWKLEYWKDQWKQSMVDWFNVIMDEQDKDYPVYDGKSGKN